MIHLSNGTYKFGSTTAIDNCSLEIKKGEHVALIGPSGSGKSSLLRIFATEIALQSGDYSINGICVRSLLTKELKKMRCDISYIPQNLALVPNLQVNQNVVLGKIGSQSLIRTMKSLILPSTRQLTRVQEILKEVGITEKIFHRTDSLSGGQQQRTAIARALYQGASIILADEPVSAVDPTRAHALLGCLTNLATKHALTVVCSLHNLKYAQTFFPRIVGMRYGEIVFDGKSSDFTNQDFNSLYQIDHG